MEICPNCSQKLREDAKFCDNCGTRILESVPSQNREENQVEEVISVAEAVQEVASEDSVTDVPAEETTEDPSLEKIVAEILSDEAESEELSPSEEAETEIAPAPVSKEKKKAPKKALLFGAVAAIAALVLAIVLIFCGGGQSRDDFTMYLKDKEIVMAHLKKDAAPSQLTARLVDIEDVEDDDFYDAHVLLALFTYMSEDGKFVIFPDKIDEDSDGLNLYYKELSGSGEKAIKIDSDVACYMLNQKEDILTYLKGDDTGNLYQYNLKEKTKEKIGSDIIWFDVSDDGSKIVYLTSEDGLYFKKLGEEKIKVVSDTSSVEYLSDDFSTVYYIKEDALYKQVIGEDKTKLASDIYDVIHIYDSGEVYYTKKTTNESALMDYVFDDLASSDAMIKEPKSPTYPKAPYKPYSWNYSNYQAYQEAYRKYEQEYAAYEKEYNRLKDQYNKETEIYEAKLSRDYLREVLKEETYKQSSYSLYFHDGTDDHLITDALINKNSFSGRCASDTPVLVFESYRQKDMKKCNLSEISKPGDVTSLVYDALYATKENYIAVKGEKNLINQEKLAGNFNLNASGTELFYIDDIPDNKNYGTLYRISIANDVVAEAELYDTDVHTLHSGFIDDNQFKYFKNIKNDKGELYVSQNHIDDDVDINSFLCAQDNYYYFVDWNGEKEQGTAKVYQNEEAITIADDVHSLFVKDDGTVLYFYDYNLSKEKGELYEWNKGVTTRIDEEVHSFYVTPGGRVLFLYDYSLNHFKGELREWTKGEVRTIDTDVIAILPVFERDIMRDSLNSYYFMINKKPIEAPRVEAPAAPSFG